MLLAKRHVIVMLCASASFLSSCGSHDSGKPQSGAKTEDKGVLNLFFWSDFLAPNTISSFEKLTGIKVRISYFDSPTPQDLTDVESVLLKIRPYIRSIDSANIIDAMANGDSCIALDSNTDAYQARNRAKETKNGVQIGFVVPQEGSLLWFNMLGIPKDAPNPANAHLFLNYLMESQVSANLSNFMGMATANSPALPLLDASIVADPDVFPPQDQQQRLFVQTEDSPEQARTLTRLWQKFKTAQ